MSTQHPSNAAFHCAYPISPANGILVARVFSDDHVVETMQLQLPLSTLASIAIGVVDEIPFLANAVADELGNTFRFNYLNSGTQGKIKITHVHLNFGNATQDTEDATLSHLSSATRRFGIVFADCKFV